MSARPGEDHAVLKVLLVGDSGPQRRQAAATLVALSDPTLEVTEADFAKPSGEHHPDVLIVLFGDSEEPALSYLQLQAQGPHPALFALLQRSSVLMRRILRAGADELLFLPLDAAAATRAFLKISESGHNSEYQPRGTIVSLASTVGGVGVTSLAASLAIALHYTLNKRVVMIDLDLQTGGLTSLLNLLPERTIMRLGESDRELDSIQLEAALTKHSSGVYLLAAPARIDESELVTEETIGSVLGLTRNLFDFVVVDCGGYIDEHAVTAWENSDFVFYVMDQSLSAARSSWRLLELFGRLGVAGATPKLLLNRYKPNHPIGEKQIADSLGQPVFAKIPRDDRAMERARLRDQDLWQVAPGSPLVRAVEDFARRIDSGGDSPPAKTPVWPRLFLRSPGLRNKLGQRAFGQQKI